MLRISTPSSIETSPLAARPLLTAVKALLGSVPNLFRVVANSPAALEGYLGLNGALAKGALDARTRERIALAVAEVNGCGYCLAAHTYLGEKVAKLDVVEMMANRRGGSVDPKAAAAVHFALAVTKARGHVTNSDLDAVKRAGYTEAEVIEIVAHVALNTLTNYINEVAKTEVDFPAVTELLAA